MARKGNTITFGRDTDGSPVAIVNDPLADAARDEADQDTTAAEEAVAAMHTDPDLDPFADDPQEQENEMTPANVADYALSPEAAVAHIAAMREPDAASLSPEALAAEARRLSANRGVRPVSGLAPNSSVRHAPRPGESVKQNAARADASKVRNADLALRDRLRTKNEILMAESEDDVAKMQARRVNDPKPAAKVPAAPKAPKTGTCIFSGLPTGGGQFRPGYDAKLKSAMIKAFRGQTPDLSLASDEMRARFETGDLSTPEGLMTYAASRDWDQYLTVNTKTATQRSQAKAEKYTVDNIKDMIVDLLIKLPISETRQYDVANAVEQAITAALREQEDDEDNVPLTDNEADAIADAVDEQEVEQEVESDTDADDTEGEDTDETDDDES